MLAGTHQLEETNCSKAMASRSHKTIAVTVDRMLVRIEYLSNFHSLMIFSCNLTLSIFALMQGQSQDEREVSD
jgi:hypothetical protein